MSNDELVDALMQIGLKPYIFSDADLKPAIDALRDEIDSAVLAKLYCAEGKDVPYTE